MDSVCTTVEEEWKVLIVSRSCTTCLTILEQNISYALSSYYFLETDCVLCNVYHTTAVRAVHNIYTVPYRVEFLLAVLY